MKKWIDYYGGLRLATIESDGVSFGACGTIGSPWPKNEMWDTAEEAIEGLKKIRMREIKERMVVQEFLIRQAKLNDGAINTLNKEIAGLDKAKVVKGDDVIYFR